jgi:hypothetical protein
MASRCMTPMIGIVSDGDRPEAKMLVVAWGTPDHPHVEYIDPKSRTMPGGPHRSNMPAHFTSLSAFGGRAGFEPDGSLRVKVSGPSNAVYPDGTHRRWQGPTEQVIGVRVKLVGPLVEAVRTQRPVMDRAAPAKYEVSFNGKPFSVVSVEALIDA